MISHILYAEKDKLNQPTFCRTILILLDYPDLLSKYHVITDDSFRSFIQAHPIYSHVNVHYLKTREKFFFHLLLNLLEEIGTSSVLLSIESYNHKLINTLHGKYPLYYVMHGVYGHVLPKLRPNAIIHQTWSPKLHYFIADKATEKMFIDGKTQFKWTRIPGLPQFDYMLYQKTGESALKEIVYRKYGLTDDCLSILIVNGTGNPKFCQESFDKLHQVVTEEMKKREMTFHIFWKPKRSMNKLVEREQVSLIMDHIYDFLWCDVIIIQEGGTSFLESMIYDSRKVILNQIDNRNQDFEIDCHKFPLMISKTVDDFRKYLIQVIEMDISLISEEYHEMSRRYLQDQLGISEIQPVSELIMKMIF